jgi:hypothetical protein
MFERKNKFGKGGDGVIHIFFEKKVPHFLLKGQSHEKVGEILVWGVSLGLN